MLVLSRNILQSIVIHTTDGIVEISVNKLKPNQVSLGITAPDHVLVMRKEVEDSSQYEEYDN
jgi:carbon storage regulator